jgi:signal-transduction protein with cAMP-binding, CBS, and nucleotidyltransferase domain
VAAQNGRKKKTLVSCRVHGATRGTSKRRTVTDITTLVQAVQTLKTADAFKAGFEHAHWQALSHFLARHELQAGELLIRQGDTDRSAYLLEQGNLQVFVSGGTPGSHRIAILRPGSMVGEPGLFADVPRSANVEAMTPCAVWALSVPSLEALCLHLPELALTLVRAAGAVMAARARANLERGMPMI